MLIVKLPKHNYDHVARVNCYTMSSSSMNFLSLYRLCAVSLIKMVSFSTIGIETSRLSVSVIDKLIDRKYISTQYSIGKNCAHQIVHN